MRKGECFIIPNGFYNLREAWNDEKKFDESVEHFHKFYNLSKDKDYVQVWCTSPEQDNWTAFRQDDGHSAWTEYFPVSLFRGHREGDSVVIQTTFLGEVELTLAQSKHRYRSWNGKQQLFEEVLENGGYFVAP